MKCTIMQQLFNNNISIHNHFKIPVICSYRSRIGMSLSEGKLKMAMNYFLGFKSAAVIIELFYFVH